MNKEEKEEFNPEEAMEFVAVELPADDATWLEMARCFIEEYVRMGYAPEYILHTVRKPFYRGLHDILEKKGEAFVQQLIDESMQQWRPRQGAEHA